VAHAYRQVYFRFDGELNAELRCAAHFAVSLVRAWRALTSSLRNSALCPYTHALSEQDADALSDEAAAGVAAALIALVRQSSLADLTSLEELLAKLMQAKRVPVAVVSAFPFADALTPQLHCHFPPTRWRNSVPF
jgi:hypothetical protein